MSPLRNTGSTPSQPRPMARVVAALGSAAAAGLTALTVACADGPTAPAGPGAAAAPAAAPAFSRTSQMISQVVVGDTTVTEFVVGTTTTSPATINIGNSSKVDFPYAVGSICDLAISSYGPGTWDAPCTASKTAVTITARSWVNAQGKVATDFQPAMRFVPGLRNKVKITLRDAALAGTRVDFCTLTGCVDEAATDKSLAPVLDPNNGFVTRVLKHFSGYTVVAN